MNTTSFHHKIRTSDITLLFQSVILGFLIGELLHLSKAIASELNTYITSYNMSGYSLILCGITAIIVFSYFIVRGGFYDIKRIFTCNRLELVSLVVLAGLGFSISAVSDGGGLIKYQEYVAKIQAQQLILLCATPVVIALALILKQLLHREKQKLSVPFFINDLPIEKKEDDLLGLSDNASRFAKLILNDGSSDSLVFGIDAPWGIGKSSFVNFCYEYWNNRASSQVIVHRFELLRYKEGTDLLEKFVHELVNVIQEHAFVPSIQSLFARYLHLTKSKNGFSIFGVRFEFESRSGTVEETLETLKVHLSELNRKIIIVIDDLDRLSWSEVKNILFAIKRSFLLPNVSYVLCYDTENLSASKQSDYGDAEKVKEFLEKFINVKTSLFLDPHVLADFVSSNISQAVSNNLQLDVHLLDQMKHTLEALVGIFKSDDYVSYQDFLGDIRKLKRLINTVMLFEIEKTDFQNSDFNKEDLIHLLLVYINYPSIFRKIYNSETGDKNGFFSLVFKYQRGNGRFENSGIYNDYVKQLAANQMFLLNKIFQAHEDEQGIDESEITSRARYNGQGNTNRNLERYLNLIVKLSKQDKRVGYQFYINMKDELLGGAHLDEIFKLEDFSYSNGDFTRSNLWDVVANSAYEMGPNIGSNLIVYLMETLPDYSFFESEKIGAGSRIKLVYSLLKFLDVVGWGANISNRRINSDENILEIAEWIFAEGKHADTGVLNTLSRADRGPLGLYDLLLFRLYCSADRGGSLFNLQRALNLHNDPTLPTDGLSTELAKEGMRKISQMIFRIFSEQYIERKINIFEAIDSLSLEHFAGKTNEFINKQIKSREVSANVIDDLLSSGKSRLKIFIVYQLGNSKISSGVGCGYYDKTGDKDNKGIASKVNEYLFEWCFNPDMSQKNYEYFLDYMLLNLSHDYDVGFVPTVEEFTKVIEKSKLKEYWLRHRSKIWSLGFESRDKRIITANYIATYGDNLRAVYRVLDELVVEPE